LVQGAHVVIQDAMEADVAEAELLVGLLQLRLPVRAQREHGATAAHAVFPEVGEGLGLSATVAAESGCHVDSMSGLMVLPADTMDDAPCVARRALKLRGRMS